jgi:uncharacterized protein YegL
LLRCAQHDNVTHARARESFVNKTNTTTRTLRQMHIIIGAIMAIAAMLIGVPAPARAQGPDPLTVERSVTPADGVLGTSEYTVTLTLVGNAASCPPRVSDVQNDIILVIDRSASMYDERGDKVRAMRAAANDFIDRVDLGRARVGIVQFDDTASVVQALTDNRDALRQAIDGIQSGSTTSIDQGVEFAMRELTSDRARAGAQPVIVLMTDGQQTDTAGAVGDAVPPIAKAREAQGRGIRVITIGLGQDADQALLQRMVAQPADFFFAPTPDQLAQVYANVAQNVVQAAAATDVVVEHTFDASAFEVVPGSISSNGAQSGDKITWPVPSVAGAPVQLTYRARARAMGNLSVTRGDAVRFLQCAETPQTLSVPGGLPVQVAQPPQLPAATPGPVPTPQVLPASTAPRTLPESLQVAAFNLFCDLSWLPWVLLLMWLLFLAWWLTRLWRRVQQKQQTCDLIPWLFVPLLITLAGFILNALAPAFCAREDVYFWRITPNQPNGRVFMTDPLGAQPAREMAALSPGTCVGCHTVSSSAGLIASTTGGGTGQIKVYTLDGDPVNVPTVVGAFSAWSPDGMKLAVSTLDNNLVIIDIAARTATPLAGASDPNVLEAMPAWSADGSTIAFVRGGAADAPFRFGGSAEIVTVPASGGTAQPLQGASGAGFSYYPAYSPDGRWLAFTRHAGGTTTYAAPEAEIFIVPAAGGNPIRLRANDAADGARLSNVSNSWATWSQDGRQLAFTSKRDDAAYDVYLTTIDGSGNSGPATPLRNAAEAGVFEHLPNWGRPPDVNVLPALLSLIPCLIPFLLVLLAWLLCKRRHRPHTLSPLQTPMPMTPPSERKRPAPLPALAPEPLWQVAPTLIVGIGGSGRWVLTHLKKTLRDGNGGTLPKDVRFVLLDTSEREETNVFRDAQNRVANVSFAGVSLEPAEMLLLNTNLSAVIQRTREAAADDAALRGWFPYDDYRARLSLGAMTLAAGTAGRRPMARAGLIEKLRNASTPAQVRSDQLGNDAAHLWQTLIDGSNQVKSADGQLVRVVVVGSLAGGMSGVLYDVAYLARLAARQVVSANGTVTVEGYLATPGAFDRAGVGQNATRLNVNAAAAARELERFQLSEGFPFPMTYAGDAAVGANQRAVSPVKYDDKAADLPLQHGVCDWMLFDHVTLFGGEGSMDRGAGKSDQPWATVFASMADVIALRMDGATHAGAAGDYHAGLRNDIAARQASEGKAVVSAAGSFVYRLPLRDIIDIAQAQWARRLAHAFVHREDEATTNAAAEKAAQAFVSGAFAAQAAPMGMKAAGTLATGGALQTADVQELAAVSVDGESGDPFAGYLAHALETILNARATGEAMPAGVQGARAFLQQVQTRLATALQSARMQAAAAPAGANGSFFKRVLGGAQVSQLDWEAASLRVQGWLNRVGRATASLDQAQAVFDGDERDGRDSRGVLAELEARQALAESRRKQMDQVAARRYVWTRAKRADADPSDATNQIEIVDDLLQQADAQLEESLNRFGWRAQPDGALGLEIVRGDKPITLKASDAPATWAEKFVGEASRLAEHVVTDAAKSLALHDALLTQMPKASDRASALVEQAWRWAQPHLAASRDVNGDLDGRRLAAAGVPLGVQQHAELSEVANTVRSIGTQQNRINLRYEPCATSFITATDRTAFTLVREYTLMPLFALPEMQAAWRVYARNAGTEVEPTTEGAALATVFSAEQTAMAFERRLESEDPLVVNEDFRALHPLVVLALARPGRAELYACAFAAGWIAQQGGAARLTLPDGRAFTFDLRGRATATAGLDWRIAGLLRFAAGEADDEPAAEALRAALADARNAPRQAWQAFLRSFRATGGQRPFAHEPQAVRDLAAVAALAAYARLVPAEDREARWNRMVMRRARRV